jgi:hypothetical protein
LLPTLPTRAHARRHAPAAEARRQHRPRLRRRWRLITAVAAVSLLLGSAVLVATRGGDDKSVVASAAPDAALAARPPDARPPPASDAALANITPDAQGGSIATPRDAATPSVAVAVAIDAAPPDARAVKEGSEVIIETVPAGASIWIAGEDRGTAPLALRFDTSTTKLTIEARKSGYTTKKQTVVLEGKTSVQFNLQKTRRSDRGSSGRDRPPRPPVRPPTRPKNPPNDLMRP